MHRSGTSAVAGTFGLLGATLPKDLLAVRPTNPKGHFESDGVLAVNEQMLQATGSAWYDVRHIACANLEPALAAEFRGRLLDALQRSYGDSSLFVLKDPRVCRFFPLALSAIEDFGASPDVVFCFRNPLEVADSLRLRDGISLPHGLSLWLRHVLDAELHSRGLPRVFINFADFLRDWRGTVRQIEEQLGIGFPRRESDAMSAVDGFLDQGLHHNLASLDELEKRSEQGWLYACFQAFSELVRDPHNMEAMKRLDLIHMSFDQSAKFFGAGIQDYYTELLKYRAELFHAKKSIAHVRSQLKATKESRSWRLTALIRSAGTSLRRLRG